MIDPVEIVEGRLVGGGFLPPAIGEHLPHGGVLAGPGDHHAGFGRGPGRDGRGAEGEGEHDRAGRLGIGFGAALLVPARDVPGFVGQYALDLVGGVGGRDQAGMHEDLLPRGHEGVEARIAHQVDFHGTGLEPRGDKYRVRIVPQILLDFRIAQQGLGGDGPDQREQHQKTGEKETDGPVGRHQGASCKT